MKFSVEKSTLSGRVRIPGSKSHTIRAVAISSLAEGGSVITNPLVSEDTLSAVNCYRQLGADIDTSDEKRWVVEGNKGFISVPAGEIDVGNSGTTLRLAIGSASLNRGVGEVVLTGDDQVRSRSVGPLLDCLCELGAEAVSVNVNGCAPVSVKGVYRGGKTRIKCVTSQYLSSLLFAGPMGEVDTEIDVEMLNEPDYVQITLDWLDSQEIEYSSDGMKRFWVKGGQCYKGFESEVPGDFSSGTFFLCGGALLGGEIEIEGLDMGDSQPDKLVVNYLQAMGSDIHIEDGVIRICGGELRGANIDMNRTPDALPALAVTAAFSRGVSRLYNVAQARKKETDRISCMARELRKLGAVVEESEDGLTIEGSGELNARGKLKANEFDGYGDHRIVMAMSLAGMVLDGESVINTAEAVRVTFPEFRALMNSVGGRIRLID
jgi:3-phosphoshikimate 1-carboxyvinyltransferase